MKKVFQLFLFAISCLRFESAYSQGWTADVSIDLNHPDYAMEQLTSASVTFSEITQSAGPSSNSQATFTFTGTGEPSGNLLISANGIATEPYDRNASPSVTLTVTYSGTHANLDCITYNFYANAGSSGEIYGTISIYPRIAISTVSRNCSNISLATNTCSNGSGFTWEVSESTGGPWKIISGKRSSTLVVTPDELYSLGLSSKYGTKYFRVSGLGGTTSLIETVEIYYPGPQATFSVTDPKCHDGTDGSITVKISSAIPDINHFVLTVFKAVPPENQYRQIPDVVGFSTTVENLPSGSYWVRLENNSSIDVFGSCYTDFEVTPLKNPANVTIPSFDVSDYNSYAISCKGGSDGVVEAKPAGGTGTYTEFAWTPNVSSTSKAINLSEQTYSVKVKDSNGCWSGDNNIKLSAPDQLIVAMQSAGGKGGYDVSCWNKQDGTINTTTTGGVGSKSYLWSTGATLDNISELSPGTYSVTLTDANGCTDFKEIILTAPDPILFAIEEVNVITCPGMATGSLEGTFVENTIGDVYYSWSSGEATSVIEGKTAGTYSLTVSDDQGCSTTKSRSLADPPAYTVAITPQSDYNGSLIKCNGESNGKIGTVTRDASNNITIAEYYAWFKNGIAISEGVSINAIDNLNKGTYKVIITYNTSCQAEADFTLADPDPVSAIVSITSDHNGQHISCTGASDGSLHAQGTGGTGGASAYTFVWNTGETGSDLIEKTAGTYSVTVTDLNGCTGSASKSLNDPLPVSPSIAITSNYNGLAISCHNNSDGSLEASATGGTNAFTFYWNTGFNGPALSGIPAGTYTVTAIDLNGCSKNISKTIDNADQVIATIEIISNFNGQPISCFDKTDGRLQASASGGTDSFTYLWNTGSSGKDLSGIGEGTYTVTASDMNGCQAIDSESLINPIKVEALITEVSNYNGYGISCSNANDGYIKAAGTGGTENYSFYWANIGETNSIASSLGAGKYTVDVTDLNGCSGSATQEIIAPSPVGLSLTDFRDISCNGDDTGILSLNASGGTGVYKYSINDGAWQIDNNFTNLKAADYLIKVQDSNDCISALSKTLSEPEKIEISYTIEPAFCNDPRGQATAFVRGGVGQFAYEWRDITNLIISTSSTITDKSAGIYTFRTVDENNCELAEQIGITSTDGAKVVVKENVSAMCSYSADGSALLEITEGNGPFEFLWPDGQTAAQGISLAKGSYPVTITDINDCIAVVSVDISAPDLIEVDSLQTTMPSCFEDCDGKIKIKATGGVGSFDYSWNNQTGEEATNLCAGIHKVTIADGNGCLLEETIALGEPEPLQLQLISRQIPKCHAGCDGSMEVEASGGNGEYQYTWASGTSTAAVSNICSGDHMVQVTDNKNCTMQRIFTLGEPTVVQVRLVDKQLPVCHDGCDATLSVEAFGGTGGYEYNWSTGVANQKINKLCAGDYSINIKDENACSVDETYTIENPVALSVDLGGSATLCVGQSHTLDVGSNWKSYSWGSNVGVSGNTSKITIHEAGGYWVEVVSNNGCLARDTFLLETSRDLLEASFLIPKEANTGDTIVIVDISWPLPETTTWTFPTAMNKLLDLGDVIYGQFDDPGIYEIGLNVYLAECSDHIGKTIAILKGTEDIEGGRLGYNEYVKEFSLYPNPTEGNFEVNVEYSEQGPATISIWNTPTGYLIKQIQDNDKNSYHWEIDLRPLSVGTYVIRLDHLKGKKYLRFVVR